MGEDESERARGVAEQTRLLDLVKKSYMQVVWTHKIHENQADIYERDFGKFEVIRIIVLSLTVAGVISLLILDEYWVKVALAICSVVSCFIEFWYKSFKLPDVIEVHKHVANMMVDIRDRYQILIWKFVDNKATESELLQEYESLKKETQKCNELAPRTTEKAVMKAEKALKERKDEFVSKEELELCLPKSLANGS